MLLLTAYHMVCSEEEKRIEQRRNRSWRNSADRRRWLEEGLALLEEAGAEALTIESLTTRLGVTKGSFYHHFTNYQDFKERLLSFCEEEGTLRIIHGAEQEASPADKLAWVLRASFHPSPLHRLDVALRAWALQDAQVRVYQQRIDQQRLAYLEALVTASTEDPVYARQQARAFYCLYVGSQHILPPLQGEDLNALYQLVQGWFAKENQTCLF